MSYVKPAALIRHLEAVIGREAVDAGLTRYLTAHAFADAVTDDLVRCWEQVAGADLTTWSDEWLRTAGVNTLELEIATTGGVVKASVVRQGASSPGERLRSHHQQRCEPDDQCDECFRDKRHDGGARTQRPGLGPWPDRCDWREHELERRKSGHVLGGAIAGQHL